MELKKIEISKFKKKTIRPTNDSSNFSFSSCKFDYISPILIIDRSNCSNILIFY